MSIFMARKEVIERLYQAMGGFLLFGAVIVFLAPQSRKIGFSFLAVGILIGTILQFFLGEDVIRWRKIKEMK